ncbi:glycoside hydrolase superfamily [Chytriomyces sp. MP71]|nr:glycoside hydrolase superfamily [Chytriomyces sp. MP71]
MKLTLLSLALASIGVLAGPIERRATCTNGAWQCSASGNALQQCSYDSTSALNWINITNCSTGTVCSIAVYGCVPGTQSSAQPPTSTSFKTSPTPTSSSAKPLTTTSKVVFTTSSAPIPTTTVAKSSTFAPVSSSPAPSSAPVATSAGNNGGVCANQAAYAYVCKDPQTLVRCDASGNIGSTQICSTGLACCSNTCTWAYNCPAPPPPTGTGGSPVPFSPSPVPTPPPVPSHKYKFITYWGQNSGKFTNGQNQLRLIEYCKSDNFDVINIAFLSIFGGASPTKYHLDLDFFGAYDTTTGPVDAGTAASFLQWGQEVAACQAMGVKILLSLGGGVGSYSVPSGQGTLFAQTLHNSFFRGSGADRPFGNVILDGIDWDLEGAGSDFNEIVKVNQYLHTNNPGLLVTAAPQCAYPDAYLGPAFVLPNAGFSFINVQFYNNYCSLAGSFNYDQWVNGISVPYNIPLVIGVPGSSPSAPGGGYVPASTVQAAIQKIVANATMQATFYGVMTWDASSTTVSGMATGLRGALNSV